MFVSKNNFYISPEDYLEGEGVSPIKHEYRRGHVYAMTGAKKPHIVISVNLAVRVAILPLPSKQSLQEDRTSVSRIANDPVKKKILLDI